MSYSLTWLPFLGGEPPIARCAEEAARAELERGLAESDPAVSLCLDDTLGQGYRVERASDGYTISGGADGGLLYGVYRLLAALRAGVEPTLGLNQPAYSLRMLNCWDNADGSVERGYAGRSIFFDNGVLSYDASRIRQLGRMLASVGVNALCINNVNVVHPANLLIMPEGLNSLAELAALLRPFAVRLLVAVDYASPTYYGVPTADPLDPRVADWWRERADAVYAEIPDLAGFVVKADSEHRPGPFTYGRDHAEGANMLARALKPHGGVLVWRCFVYNCKQDWRDASVDRPKAAYEHYAYLDGRFDDNVILQIKNGPFDFQAREPVSPLLFAMPKTRKAMEVQLTQEYTGQQIDVFAMPDMWSEVMSLLPQSSISAVTAVGNLGACECWTGHPFAQFNLFAYGRFAWNPRAGFDELAREWCRLSYSLPRDAEDALCRLLKMSRGVYEQYAAPLGICWMVYPHSHYGPSPDGYEYTPWGTYHKADRDAVGIDRTSAGTGYTRQYPPELAALYESLSTCPDELLLFFHRLPYTYVMRDGRTLIQRIYDDHFEGAERVDEMEEILKSLPLDAEVKDEAVRRMEMQKNNAREWRDVINTFFRRLSGIDDEKGRRIYP